MSDEFEYDDDFSTDDDVYDGAITPLEAQAEINKTMEEVRSNPKHPYLDKTSPMHEAEVQRMLKLREVINPPKKKQTDGEGEPLAEQPPRELLEAMEQGLNLKANKDANIQAARVAEARDEMKKLVELGYADDSNAITDDIAEFEVRALKGQRLCAEGKYNELGVMLRDDLRKLDVVPEMQEMLDRFLTIARPDDELSGDILDDILHFVYKQNMKFKKGSR